MTKISLPSLSEANELSAQILKSKAEWWKRNGGAVVSDELVPNNFKTGKANHSAQRTTLWQTPVQNGSFYEIDSPRNLPFGTLKSLAAAGGIKFGCAVNRWHLANVQEYRNVIAEQCDIIVSENSMKWVRLEEVYNNYTFTDADNAYDFAVKNNIDMRFHTLTFQDKYPDWVDPQSATEAINLLERHVENVLMRWQGKMTSWDIVNEPFMSLDGVPYYDTVWTQQIGNDWVKEVFDLVASYNLGGKLVLNENGFKNSDGISVQKRDALLRLVQTLVARGVQIDAVGIQSHLKAHKSLQDKKDWQDFLLELQDTGVEIYITELDIDDREISGTDEERAQAAADYVEEYLENTLEVITPKELLTWGIYDGSSLNNDGTGDSNTPIGHPLPYDGNFDRNPLWSTLEKIFLQFEPVPVEYAPITDNEGSFLRDENDNIVYATTQEEKPDDILSDRINTDLTDNSGSYLLMGV